MEKVLVFFVQSSKVDCFVDILHKYKAFASTTSCKKKKSYINFIEQFSPYPLINPHTPPLYEGTLTH